jgi:hypothetical protein
MKVGVWCTVRARRIVGPVLLKKQLQKICTGHSRAILSIVKRRRKTLWLVSARLIHCPHHTYVYAGSV